MPDRRPVFYLRKSLTKNADNDLDAHKRRSYARMVERGESDPILIVEPEGHRSAGDDKQRPGYAELEALIKADKVSTLFINDRARVWRNDTRWIEFLYLCKAHATEIIPLTENSVGNVSDSNERLIEYMQGNRNQAYREYLSNTHRALKADLNDAGIFAGAYVFGLRLVGSKFTRHFEPNADFATVVELLEIYVSDHGTPYIANELIRRGRTWARGAKRTRPDPTIILNLIHHVERYEPFLPPDLYADVIAMRKRRALNRSNSRQTKYPPMLLRMLLTCDYCGTRFYTQADYMFQGQRVGHYFHSTYRCPNSRRWHRGDVLHQQLREHMLWLNDEQATEAQLEKMFGTVDAKAIDYTHAREKIATQLANLEDAYLAGDLGELEKARPHYRKKRADLESKLAELPAPLPAAKIDPDLVRIWFKNLHKALFEGLSETDPAAANNALRSMFDHVPVRDAVLLAPVWLSP